MDRVSEFFAELNESSTLEQFDDPHNINVGKVLAAPFDDNGKKEFYRAKVLKIIKDKNTMRYYVRFFIISLTASNHLACNLNFISAIRFSLSILGIQIRTI